MSNLGKRTPEQVLSVMEKKGYLVFKNGNYNLNIIAVRENDEFENNFSDTLYVIYYISGAIKMLEIPWTTLAGTKGKGGSNNPLTGKETGTGVDGVAVIVEGQYRKAYEFVDTYNGFLSYPYFNQIWGYELDYYRDNDKDRWITRGKIYKGDYRTCLHRMSNNGVNSKEVNLDFVPWSQGCNGAPEPEFKKLVELTRKAVSLWGNKFTYTILHAKDF